MNARCLVDGVAGTSVDAGDRGLCYGDGLFETVLLVAGRAPLWPRHMARLAEGGRRLQLPLPSPAQLWQELQQAAAGLERAVVRITVSRGSGPRGYAPPAQPSPLRVVSAAVAPAVDADWYALGIRVRCCRMRLAAQPVLAGLKHLNRLEQVLARAEWRDPAIAEGLLCDQDGRVVGATAANVFAVIDGQLCTPKLDRCGVAGVARAELLARAGAVRVDDFELEEWMQAEEMFLTSSVRGIVPVAAVDARRFGPGPVTRAWQQRWRDAVPGAGA